jgi:hypothetical protein
MASDRERLRGLIRTLFESKDTGLVDAQDILRSSIFNADPIVAKKWWKELQNVRDYPTIEGQGLSRQYLLADGKTVSFTMQRFVQSFLKRFSDTTMDNIETQIQEYKNRNVLHRIMDQLHYRRRSAPRRRVSHRTY